MTISRRKQYLLNLLVFLGSLLLCLALGEVLIRIIQPMAMRFISIEAADSKLGFRLKPNRHVKLRVANYKFEIQTNSQGLRDREFTIPKPSNVFRIVALGDSFTFGWAVSGEQSYPKQLEKLLNEKLSSETGLKYEVVNTGVFLYGPIQYDSILRNQSMKYQPDLVIMGLFPMNDVEDVMNGVDYLRRGTKIRQLCYLYTYLHSKYILITCARNAKKGKMLLPLIAQDHYSPEFTRALERTKKYIFDSNQFCLKNQAPFVLAILPYEFQVEPIDKANKELAAVFTDKVYNVNMVKMSSLFSDFASQNNILNLDMLSTFRASPVRPLYNPYEGHWSPQGNQLATESLFGYLTIHHLVPISRSKN